MSTLSKESYMLKGKPSGYQLCTNQKCKLYHRNFVQHDFLDVNATHFSQQKAATLVFLKAKAATDTTMDELDDTDTLINALLSGNMSDTVCLYLVEMQIQKSLETAGDYSKDLIPEKALIRMHAATMKERRRNLSGIFKPIFRSHWRTIGFAVIVATLHLRVTLNEYIVILQELSSDLVKKYHNVENIIQLEHAKLDAELRKLLTPILAGFRSYQLPPEYEDNLFWIYRPASFSNMYVDTLCLDSALNRGVHVKGKECIQHVKNLRDRFPDLFCGNYLFESGGAIRRLYKGMVTRKGCCPTCGCQTDCFNEERYEAILKSQYEHGYISAGGKDPNHIPDIHPEGPDCGISASCEPSKVVILKRNGQDHYFLRETDKEKVMKIITEGKDYFDPPGVASMPRCLVIWITPNNLNHYGPIICRFQNLCLGVQSRCFSRRAARNWPGGISLETHVSARQTSNDDCVFYDLGYNSTLDLIMKCDGNFTSNGEDVCPDLYSFPQPV